MATLGPDSFVLPESGGTPLSQGPGSTPGMNSSQQIGGGSASVMIDTSGAIKSLQSNLQTVDTLTKFAKGIIDPKVEKIQKDLVWQGVQRAAAGQDMDQIRGDTPWLSRMLNSSFMVKGAASYKANSALAELARETADNEEIKAMNPDQFRQWLVGRIDGLRTGDPDVDGIIEGQAMQSMPAVFARQASDYELKVKTDLERERFNSNVNTATNIQRIYQDMALGKISPENGTAQISAMEASISAKGDDETDEGYSRRILRLAQETASTGNMTVLSLINRSGAAESLTPEARISLRGLEDSAYRESLRLSEARSPGVHVAFQTAISNAETQEEAEAIAASYNEWTRLQAGISGPGSERHRAVDEVEVGVTRNLAFRQASAEETRRLNEFERHSFISERTNLIRALYKNGKREEADALASETYNQWKAIGGKPSELPSDIAWPHIRREGSEAEIQRRIELEEKATEKQREAIQKKEEEAKRIGTAVNNLLTANQKGDVLALLTPGEAAAVVTIIRENLKDNPEKMAKVMVNMVTGNIPHKDDALANELINPLRSSIFDPNRVNHSVMMYRQILSDPAYGALAAEKWYGKDMPEKINKWIYFMDNPQNHNQADRMFKEIFGTDNSPSISAAPSQNDMKYGLSAAESKSSGAMYSAITNDVETTPENIRIMQGIYARSRAEAANINPNAQPHVIDSQAKTIAETRFKLLRGNTLVEYEDSPQGRTNLEAELKQYDLDSSDSGSGTTLRWDDGVMVNAIDAIRTRVSGGKEVKELIGSDPVYQPTYELMRNQQGKAELHIGFTVDISGYPEHKIITVQMKELFDEYKVQMEGGNKKPIIRYPSYYDDVYNRVKQTILPQ